MWEILSLAFVITVGFGVAIIMVRKVKAPKITVISTEKVQNNDELTIKIAKLVAKEVIEEVMKNSNNISKTKKNEQQEEIDIDSEIDKVIPIAIESINSESQMDKAIKEEEIEDKGIEESKSKLAGILKKKKS